MTRTIAAAVCLLTASASAFASEAQEFKDLSSITVLHSWKYQLSPGATAKRRPSLLSYRCPILYPSCLM
ncbi:hypothetical protein ACFSQQ_39915 [Mesorhizobium kowhaii]|uniref:hypothetical protein n=1 Tax=Mesorhizobium kowhaii TaxID=1300272 RepID=UPI0035EFDB87